jgi:hypothetical protein
VSILVPLSSALVYLNISSTSVGSLEPLAACSGLLGLEMNECATVRSLEPLAACGLLQTLSMAGCTSVGSLEPLAACGGLLRLSMQRCAPSLSVAPLSACGKLEDIQGCDEVASLEAQLGALFVEQMQARGTAAMWLRIRAGL